MQSGEGKNPTQTPATEQEKTEKKEKKQKRRRRVCEGNPRNVHSERAAQLPGLLLPRLTNLTALRPLSFPPCTGNGRQLPPHTPAFTLRTRGSGEHVTRQWRQAGRRAERVLRGLSAVSSAGERCLPCPGRSPSSPQTLYPRVGREGRQPQRLLVKLNLCRPI